MKNNKNPNLPSLNNKMSKLKKRIQDMYFKSRNMKLVEKSHHKVTTIKTENILKIKGKKMITNSLKLKN